MVPKILKTLKRLANKRIELSVLNIRTYDEDYEKAMDKVLELEKQCDSMELEQREKKVIEDLMNTMDDVEIEQSNISYLAMPLVKNVPRPSDKTWKRNVCPICGEECWDRSLPEGFTEDMFDGKRCIMCALKAAGL